MHVNATTRQVYSTNERMTLKTKKTSTIPMHSASKKIHIVIYIKRSVPKHIAMCYTLHTVVVVVIGAAVQRSHIPSFHFNKQRAI